MSSSEEEEIVGVNELQGEIEFPGEGDDAADNIEELQQIQKVDPVIRPKKLTFEEASKCLNTLGKDESGVRYAYLMITAINKKYTDISAITSFKHVIFVDVSGNFLTLEALQILAELPYLILLKAQNNAIDSGALQTLPYLQVLDLSKNKIVETNDIIQPLLETLDLSYNLIFDIRLDYYQMDKVKILDLHGNHIQELAGTFCSAVEQLYLGFNRIRRLNAPDLNRLTKLKILHLRNNKIKKLDGFSGQLENLTYLNLRDNNIRTFRQFRKLKCLPKLDTLIIIGNPISPAETNAGEREEPGEGGATEKRDPAIIPLLIILPKLKRVNKQQVTLDERDHAHEIREQKWVEIMAEESSEEETQMTDIPGTPFSENDVYTDDTTTPYTTTAGTDNNDVDDG